MFILVLYPHPLHCIKLYIHLNRWMDGWIEGGGKVRMEQLDMEAYVWFTRVLGIYSST